jgi:hypothetical protein
VKRRVLILILAAALIAVAADFVRITMDRRVYGRLEVPLFNQQDYTQAVCTIGGQKKSVATSGCGAVCIAMAASALVGSQETPETLSSGRTITACTLATGWATRRWARWRPAAACAASGWTTTLSWSCPRSRRGGRWWRTWGPARLPETAITSCSTHRREGLIRVNDPYSPERSQQTNPIDLIVREVKTSKAFLSLERDDDRAVFVF